MSNFLSRPNVNVIRHALERVDFHALRQLDDRGGLPNIEFILREAEHLVLEMRSAVWAEKIQDETAVLEVRYPRNWWQHLKHRWFPHWALRRWPVQETVVRREHKFTCKALLPDFKYEAPPGAGRYVIVSELLPPSFRVPR